MTTPREFKTEEEWLKFENESDGPVRTSIGRRVYKGLVAFWEVARWLLLPGFVAGIYAYNYWRDVISVHG